VFTRVSSIRTLTFCAAVLGVCVVVCLPLTAKTRAAFNAEAWNVVDRGAIDPTVFELALGAAACAVKSGAIIDPSTLTVIDYSRPSTARRLWVFDMHTQALLYEELVAHGKNSGDNMATRFSNELDSHQSSLGLYLTEDTYVGKNGYSLRLRGLDDGFNDRASERAIVMHGAPYVNDDVARTMGRLGRSWGCPALREGVARVIIDRVKETGLLFAYYPDAAWLKSSKYLNDCQTSPNSTN
jgi:hypothetical protein